MTSPRGTMRWHGIALCWACAWFSAFFGMTVDHDRLFKTLTFIRAFRKASEGGE